MATKRWHDDDHHQGDHDGWDQHDGDHHGRDNDFGFDFKLPSVFKIDLDEINLKKLGKITDYDISHKEMSVTFGNQWTFSIEGSGLDFSLKNGSKLPTITSGTIDTFSIDGPGKADFSISGLDLSAKTLAKAITSLDFSKVVDLVLGGDETISGSGFGDYLYAGKGNDTIFGNDGADYLIGGNGDDRVVGGRGNDYLVGGEGADTFILATKSGMDLVADFDATKDMLDLHSYGFSGSVEDFLDEHVIKGHGRCHDGEDSVVLDLGNGNMVKLEEVSRWDLDDSNILL